MTGLEAAQDAWFVSSGSWLLGEFGMEVVGSGWMATMVFLLAVRLTQEPHGCFLFFLVILAHPAVPLLKINSSYTGELCLASWGLLSGVLQSTLYMVATLLF